MFMFQALIYLVQKLATTHGLKKEITGLEYVHNCLSLPILPSNCLIQYLA